MDLYLESSLPVSAPAQAVYDWHKRPGAFERLLPPWEKIKRTQGEGIDAHTQVTLRMPLGLRWKLMHSDLKDGLGFADTQIRGPFKSWVHEHRFIETDPEHSQLQDTVKAEFPMGARFLKPYVEKKLKNLMAYRSRVLTADFECRARLPEPLPQGRILITGSNGLVGQALKSFLTTQGCTVVPLVLRKGKESAAEAFLREHGPFEAVINLCGESVLQRWSEDALQRMRQSRVDLTHWLAKALCRQEPFIPKVFISASAIGYYGMHASGMLTEDSPPGAYGFLSGLSQDWEAAAKPMQMAGSRVVWLRSGVILSPKGGMLKQMLLPFRMGWGAIMDSGLNRISWISIDDLLYLTAHILSDRHYEGPINAVAPQVINQENIARTLGAHLGKPPRMHVSRKLIKAFKGEGLAEELILSDVPVAPQRALDLGFHFTYPDFKYALSHLLPPA